MQAIFFILAVSFCGSFSVPLQPMESTDIVKEDSQIHLNQTFVSDLISNPQQFIAQVTKLDPVELQRIIALLIDLKGTSEAREADLVLALDTKNAEYVNTGNAIVDAETAVTDAQTVVTDAQGVVVVKEADLASANAAHAAKGIEKDDAQKAHDAEVPSLDDEQQVLSDVINMLEGLHPTQGVWTPVAAVSGSTLTDAAYWNKICDAFGTLSTSDIIRVEMGQVKDYFKATTSMSMCTFLTSHTGFSWSSTENGDYVVPSYYHAFFGGSADNWPKSIDGRTYLSFWGGSRGGCCHYTSTLYGGAADNAVWERDFTVSIKTKD